MVIEGNARFENEESTSKLLALSAEILFVVIMLVAEVQPANLLILTSSVTLISISIRILLPLMVATYPNNSTINASSWYWVVLISCSSLESQ